MSEVVGDGGLRRRQWRWSGDEFEQPCGSRAVIFGANERGRRGVLVGVDGRGNFGFKRTNSNELNRAFTVRDLGRKKGDADVVVVLTGRTRASVRERREIGRAHV